MIVETVKLLCALSALIGIALLYYQQFSYSPEEGLALSVCSVMLCIYAAGVCGNAAIGFYALLMLSAAGVLLYACRRRVTRNGLSRVAAGEKTLSAFFSPAILLVLCLFVLGILLFSGMCFYNWDEFVHWGKAVRFMAETNRLPVGADFDGFSYMQSCSTYFHYFITRFTGFNESCLYVSNLLLWGSALALPFSGCVRKDGGRVFLFGLTVFLAMYALYEIPYYNIYTDQPLAMWTGCLIAYWIREKNRSAKWVLGAVTLSCIATMKPQAGLLLAGIAVLCVLALLLSDRKANGKTRPLTRKEGVLLVLGIVLAVALPILLDKLWHSFSPREGFFYNVAFFKGRLLDRARIWNTLHACYQKLFTGVGGWEKLSYYSAFVMAALLLFLAQRTLQKGAYRRRFMTCAALYLAGFVLYFGVTVMTYIVFLPESDGPNATSLERYLSIYLMLGLVPMIAPFFLPESDAQTDKKALATGVSVALAVLFALGLDASFFYKTSSLKRWDDPYYCMYMQVRTGADEVTALTNGAPLYFINQKSDSAAAAAEYAFSKAWNRNAGGYRFLADGTDSGGATGLYAFPAEQLPEKLLSGDFQYLWVCTTDAYLTEQFGLLFGVPDLADGDLFAVTRADGTVALEKMATVSADIAAAKAYEKIH